MFVGIYFCDLKINEFTVVALIPILAEIQLLVLAIALCSKPAAAALDVRCGGIWQLTYSTTRHMYIVYYTYVQIS